MSYGAAPAFQEVETRNGFETPSFDPINVRAAADHSCVETAGISACVRSLHLAETRYHAGLGEY
jgi:hypothetical protein